MVPLPRLLILVVAVALAGCAKAPESKFALASAVGATTLRADLGKEPAAQTTAASAKAAPAVGKQLMNPAASVADGKDEYRVAPLDMLQVSVFQVPDLSKTVRVAANGVITLPLIGDVKAAGKSTHQLETEIAAELGAKYLQSPEVSVFVSDAVSQRITVEGAVSKPGIYPTAGPTTLMQVIALSGGLTDIADNKAILVFRTVDGKRQGAVFDYKAIRAGTVDDPVIQGGDIVAVDQSGVKAAMRNVREAIGVLNLFTPLAPLI